MGESTLALVISAVVATLGIVSTIAGAIVGVIMLRAKSKAARETVTINQEQVKVDARRVDVNSDQADVDQRNIATKQALLVTEMATRLFGTIDRVTELEKSKVESAELVKNYLEQIKALDGKADALAELLNKAYGEVGRLQTEVERLNGQIAKLLDKLLAEGVPGAEQTAREVKAETKEAAEEQAVPEVTEKAIEQVAASAAPAPTPGHTGQPADVPSTDGRAAAATPTQITGTLAIAGAPVVITIAEPESKEGNP